MKTIKFFCVTTLLFLILPTAYAAKFYQSTTGPVGEFRASSGNLGCNIGSLARFDPNSPSAYLPCMRVGGISIGQSRQEVESSLKGLLSKSPGENGLETRIYIVSGKRSAKGFLLETYLAIDYKDDVVESIQLTGKPSYPNHEFSSLKLGDHLRKVKRIIGKPTSSKVNVNGDKPVTLLDYAPYPIKLEIDNNRISTIRLSRF